MELQHTDDTWQLIHTLSEVCPLEGIKADDSLIAGRISVVPWKNPPRISVSKKTEPSPSSTFVTPKPQHYNYDMWEGIDYTIQVSEPEGHRLQTITYHGEPLRPEETYHVVLNNYRVSGGGDYSMFKGKTVVKEVQRDMVELMQAYFEKHHTLTATKTRNFRVIK